jgi:uncharacterized protein (TIGR00297 family)
VLTLDFWGVIAAVIIGVLLILFAGTMWLFFLSAIFLFLLISAAVTVVGEREKMRIGLYQKARGWKNVAANGIIPVFITFLYFINSHIYFINPNLLIVSYIASLSALAADKFASEIGVLGPKPKNIFTMKSIKKGTSGGVTILGFVAGIFASFIMSITLFHMGNFAFYAILIIISGTIGNIVDSIFGYYEEKGIGNKYTSNITCSIAGWAACMVMLL